jgi:hypothetical protein
MQTLRTTFVHLLVVASAFGLLDSARADTPPPAADPAPALAAPAPGLELQARDTHARHPGDAPARCRQATAAQSTSARAMQSSSAGLGGTHCWWQCYPGSGCQYICQFFPQ